MRHYVKIYGKKVEKVRRREGPNGKEELNFMAPNGIVLCCAASGGGWASPQLEGQRGSAAASWSVASGSVASPYTGPPASAAARAGSQACQVAVCAAASERSQLVGGPESGCYIQLGCLHAGDTWGLQSPSAAALLTALIMSPHAVQNGKTTIKCPKIQRLVTPQVLQRKRRRAAIKTERIARKKTEVGAV